METTMLRDLVEKQIGERWEAWAAAHPHLAAAIDRTRLTETTVARLREDADFTAAVRRAAVDEDKLAGAAKLVELAEKWIARALAM